MKFFKIKQHITFTLIISVFIFLGCNPAANRKNKIAASQSILDTGRRFIIIKKDTAAKINLDSVKLDSSKSILQKDTIIKKDSMVQKPVIKPNVNQQQLVDFAKTLFGKPYFYGAKDPEKGFDNSGFVNYVFGNFNIEVPRYTAGFMNVGKPLGLPDAAEGDIILFSKTDSIKTLVNSIGIVISKKGQPIEFIHAASGKTNSVTITKMNDYYQKRLIGLRRVMN
ncbi:C40 family peptidase [Pedobacter sp. SD-b]|uniref:C40 family peptidase n=1 Tax=Pedobacter segetis TaxID=2793069 RepID=A0ABS1BFR1_9SPHI|nr:C40 family peptidase [Pedobacter segetis]MBK0381709.1 C40 family peptidase [Pedobacter segetis]